MSEGPEVGAGVQLNAHPIFQPGADVTKAALDQSPRDWVGPRRTREAAAGVEAGVVAVDEGIVDVGNVAARPVVATSAFDVTVVRDEEEAPAE